jgi:uncharacterized protein with GYD domain
MSPTKYFAQDATKHIRHLNERLSSFKQELPNLGSSLQESMLKLCTVALYYHHQRLRT